VNAELWSWRFDAELGLGLGLALFLYARGWLELRRLAPERFPAWRLAVFTAGIATVAVATASPLDALADLSLQAHMLQHVLLVFVAPPLLWLAWPVAPLLRGVPSASRKRGLGPFLAWRRLHLLLRWLVHPAVAWSGFVLTLWLWHLPALYELALRSPGWHAFEHALFLGTALLFWFPVVQPWPSRRVWPRAALIPYLMLAGLQGSLFSALFAFSDRSFYPAYAEAPRLLGIDPALDQAAAGALMWVLGSLALLVALALEVMCLLQRPGVRPSRPLRVARSLRRSARTDFDLLRVPLLGPALRSLHTRQALQALMLLLALVVVLDGLLGPPIAPLNLAGVLPWTWWRGLVVIGLLVAGNLFCMACPFTLPRGLARRIGIRRRAWPRALRSKWLAIALLVLYLIGYEVFDPWELPVRTAWIAIGYFVAAFCVDALFEGAGFCKYVCPIGQFNFVNAGVSPLEVRVRRASTCAGCATQDCIRGGPRGPGCGLELAQPAKRGNLDCTFCLDCARACPHDNVGLLAARRLELADDAPRSGIGRLSRRMDLAILALVLVFGAFANAAGMVAPVVGWQAGVAQRMGIGDAPLCAALLLLALCVAPLGLVAVAVGFGQRLSRASESARALLPRFAFALIPIGFAMWMAHFGFHLATAGGSALDAAERALRGVGGDPHAAHRMAAIGMGSASTGLVDAELVVLGVGLLLALRIGWRVCRTSTIGTLRALWLGSAWALLATALYALGVWIVLQPMEMRGALS